MPILPPANVFMANLNPKPSSPIRFSFGTFTSLNKIKKKWTSFGWYVQEVNGHSIIEIISSLNKIKKSNKPNLIIANTIKGKGLSIMENDPVWHVKKLTDKNEIMLCKKELGL